MMKKRSVLLGAATLIAAGGIALSNGNVIQAEGQEEAAAVREESGPFPMQRRHGHMRNHHFEHHHGRMNGENGFGPHCRLDQ